MTDYAEEQRSELEVLESIFPDELANILKLVITYTPTYPDEPPEMDVEVEEGEVNDDEKRFLLDGLAACAEESLGMAMVFTLASQLKELLAEMLVKRRERIAKEDEERFRREEEAVAAKKRGTPVTKESFAVWSKKFEAELASQKQREEEDRIKALPPKEREEAKRWYNKLSGRQQFEQDAKLFASDSGLVEEGDEAIDISQYEREEGNREEEDEVESGVGRLRFGEMSDDE